MSSQTILVTGAAGFLGSHLCDALLAEGHTVLGMDNLSTGSTANLDHLSSESRFRFLEQDITRAFDPGRVDSVFNFASPASPVDYTRLGVETLQVGSAGTLNTLEVARTICMHPPQSATAIRRSTPRSKPTGGTSIPSAPVRCTTRPSDSQRQL